MAASQIAYILYKEKGYIPFLQRDVFDKKVELEQILNYHIYLRIALWIIQHNVKRIQKQNFIKDEQVNVIAQKKENLNFSLYVKVCTPLLHVVCSGRVHAWFMIVGPKTMGQLKMVFTFFWDLIPKQFTCTRFDVFA